MENINEKLRKFSALVLQDAREQHDRLVEETEDKYKSIMSEKENGYLQKAYTAIQKSKTESKKQADEELLHMEMDSKKKLFLKREEIINSVVSSVKEKLHDFVESDGYGEWLINRTERAVSEAGDGEKVVYVSDGDMRYRDMLKHIPGGSDITVEAAADKGFMGGVKVYNSQRRVSVDYSFKELLTEERQSFLQRSGLAIR